MRHKSDGPELTKKFLVDTRAGGIPSMVGIAISGGGGEFRRGKFGYFCRSRGVAGIQDS